MSSRSDIDTIGKRARQPALPSLAPTLAAILWLPQAAMLALAIARIADQMGWHAVVFPACVAALIGIIRAIIASAGERASYRHARTTVSALRADAITALATRAPLDLARIPSGEAASIIAEQAETITPWLARFGPARIKAVLLPLVIFLAILPLSWVAALVLLIAMPVIPVFMALIGWQAQAASKAQLAEIGSMNAVLLDRLRGIATIRGFGAVDRVTTRVGTEAQALRSRTMAVLRIAFLTSAMLELFAALGVAMVAVYVGFHLLGDLPFGAWGDKLSLGQGMFILMLAPAFFEPLRELSAIWHDKAAGEAAHRNLMRLTAEGGAVPVTSTAAITQTAPAVRVTGLRFHHSDHGAALPEGLDFTLAPGGHLALTGASGAGKTTLLSLIAGLARPEAGLIEIDGTPMTADTAPALRARMAWIGQNPHIFAGTLAQNVTLGRKGIGAADIGRALSDMHLGDMAHARGSVPIGEGGGGISGGEALRLALARIAVCPAGLILADEPTAHLDLASAESITDSLLELARGRTLIVATHDPRLAARMDYRIDLTISTTGEAA